MESRERLSKKGKKRRLEDSHHESPKSKKGKFETSQHEHDSYSHHPSENSISKEKAKKKKKQQQLQQSLQATESVIAKMKTEKKKKKKQQQLQQNLQATESVIAKMKTEKKKKKKPPQEESEEQEEEVAASTEDDSQAGQTADESKTDDQDTNGNSLKIIHQKNPEGMKNELFERLMKDRRFSAMEGAVSEKTLRAIREELKFDKLTFIQLLSIPFLLELKDGLGVAKTGSGKTLAFLLPGVELLYKIRYKPRNGVGALFLSPTRELALQTYSVLTKLLKYHSQTHGLLIGGGDKKQEAYRLMKGANFLVATPGRLLYHLQNTEHFNFGNVWYLVIDEADLMLDMGFEPQIRAILELLPCKYGRQSVLFSATSERKIEKFGREMGLLTGQFARFRVQSPDQPTVTGLQQGYHICPIAERFSVLYSFLRRNMDKKVMVFMSTKKAVEFFQMLFNRVHLPAKSVHAGHEQNVRSRTYRHFCKATQGVLLCTNVAARGLDIPKVDWIFQYDPPEDIQEYIHRVGRTARGVGGQGNSVLLLHPGEEGFAQYLQEAKVPLSDLSPAPGAVQDLQPQLESIVRRNPVLNKAAKQAYEAYVRSYASHKQKDVFDLQKLNLNHVAKTFGLLTPPHVHLGDGSRSKARGWQRGGW